MSLYVKSLAELRDSICARKAEILSTALKEKRQVNAEDQRQMDELDEALKTATERYESAVEYEKREAAIQAEMIEGRANAGRISTAGSALAFRGDVLDALQVAIASRSTGHWEAGVAMEEQRAAFGISATGARVAWAANVLRGPRLLHEFAGVPSDQPGSVKTSDLRVGAIAAADGVAENVTVGEFAAFSPVETTAERYGRFSDFSRESSISSDAAGSVTMAHRRGIARDLDNLLISTLETTAVSGSTALTGTDNDEVLRLAIATVADAGSCDPTDLVAVIPVAVAPSIGVLTPANADDVGSAVVRFAGAKVYVTSLLSADTVGLVFDPQGQRFHNVHAMAVDNDVNVKTSTLTVATSIIASYGAGLYAGSAARVTLDDGSA